MGRKLKDLQTSRNTEIEAIYGNSEDESVKFYFKSREQLNTTRSSDNQYCLLHANKKATNLKFIKPQFNGFLEWWGRLFVKFQSQDSRVHKYILGAEKKNITALSAYVTFYLLDKDPLS